MLYTGTGAVLLHIRADALRALLIIVLDFKYG